jgi:phosphoribosylformylglycinamidine synthase
MVGKLPDAERSAPAGFVREGDTIAFCGEFDPSLEGSELAKLRGDALPTALGERDLEKTRRAHEAVRGAVRAGELSSAHDVAEGGLLVAIAESCLAGGLGAEVDPWPDSEPLLWMFGECPGGGFVVSAPREAIDRLAERTPLTVFGTVGGDSLRTAKFELSLSELNEASGSLAAAFP